MRDPKPRFKELRENYYKDKGDIMNDMSVDDLATKANISRNIIYKLETTQTHYTVDNIKAYRDFFKVSADYILGLSDQKPVDEDVKMISKYTGLTEDSIKQLHNMKNVYGVQYGRWISALNAILEDDRIIYLLSDLIYPPKSAEAVSQNMTVDEEGLYDSAAVPIFDEDGEGTLILNPDSPDDVHRQNIAFRLLEISFWEELKQHVMNLRDIRKDGDSNSKESSITNKRNKRRN